MHLGLVLCPVSHHDRSALQMGSSKDQTSHQTFQTPKDCNSFNFLCVVSRCGCSDWKCWRNFFCPNLFLHSFWAEKQSQLSCSFVLIARKEFLCFNYKKIWGKNFFCPVGALSIAITQAQCFNWAVYSAWSRYPSFCPDTETQLSTILKNCSA